MKTCECEKGLNLPFLRPSVSMYKVNFKNLLVYSHCNGLSQLIYGVVHRENLDGDLLEQQQHGNE